MSNWDLVSAEKMYKNITDGTHDSPKAVEIGYPLVTSKNIKGGVLDLNSTNYISEEDYKNIIKRSKVDQWDLIISMIGEYCGYTYLEKNKNTNYAIKNVGVFKTDSRLESEWLKYYLKSSCGKYYLNLSKSGSSQPYISLGALRKLPILSPPLDIKKKIVNVLSSLDDKIELNNQINDNLEHMAKTLYGYWFVQFDFPNENRKPYKSSGGKMIWNEILKREIPEGWKVTVFNDWIEKTKTGDWGKDKIEGNYTEKVYCIRGADINGLNGKGEVKAPQRYILKNNISKALKPDDFIVEISGGSPTQSTGRIALLTESTFERFDSNIICSNFCKAISLKENEFSFNFLQEWQRLYDANVFFGYEGKTSGIKNFLFESFMESYFVIKPPKVLVERFYNQIKNIESKKQSNLKQNQQLSQLRDWLLPMLMNGQVKVE